MTTRVQNHSSPRWTLESYDQAKRAIQEVVDLPDRKIDLFIRLCLQTRGRLSATKRSKHFATITDDELEQMENVVRAHYGESPSPPN